MAAWLIPVLTRGALLFAGAKSAQVLYDKGESMIRQALAPDDDDAQGDEEAEGEEAAPPAKSIGAEEAEGEEAAPPAKSIGEYATDVLENLDIFDLFGRKKARHDAEQAAAQKERAADKAANKKQAAAEEKARKAQEKADKARDAALSAQVAKQGGDFTAALDRMRNELAAAQRAAQTAAQRADVAQRQQNMRALLAAQAAANKPNALDDLKKIVEVAKSMVVTQGTLPDASAYQDHVSPQDMYYTPAEGEEAGSMPGDFL